jgi:nucleoside-diphosphate-sugar epimerase
MIPLKDRRIVLIGGAGFIGHNLALSLKEQGAHVEIIDSLQVNNLLAYLSNTADVPNRELYLQMLNDRQDLLRKSGIPLHVIDARDYHQLSLAMGKIKPQVVVHLAAISHAGKSNKDPFSTFDHNLRTLENALDVSRGKVEHFIFFSSSMVYGNFPNGFASEETPCEPIGIYGALKFAGEKMVIAYNQVFDLPYTIVRPSALYGERCVSRRVAQIFVENAIAGKEITVNGTGDDALDFTNVHDLVGGIVRVIGNEAARNQIFNLTYGKSRTLNELLGILAGHFPNLKVNFLPKDVLMPDRGTLSVEKAKKLIGYEPSFPVEIGFDNYIQWYKSRTCLVQDWSAGTQVIEHIYKTA